MSLSSFIARYTAPVAAMVREGMTAGSGHWLTIHSDEEGGGTHVWVNAGGSIAKGPKALIGGKLSDFGHHKVTHHPVGHVPAGAKDHPSYTEHPSSQAKPKAEKPEGAQESAIKNPGKPYARLHGADQGTGAASDAKGTPGAPEAHSAPHMLTDAEEHTVAHYTAHQMQKSPDEKRMLARNMESQHDERMQAMGMHAAHPKHILAAAAAKLRDRADYEEGKGKYASTASEAHSAQEGPEPLTKEQAEAGLATARAESNAASGNVTPKADAGNGVDRARVSGVRAPGQGPYNLNDATERVLNYQHQVGSDITRNSRIKGLLARAKNDPSLTDSEADAITRLGQAMARHDADNKTASGAGKSGFDMRQAVIDAAPVLHRTDTAQTQEKERKGQFLSDRDKHVLKHVPADTKSNDATDDDKPTSPSPLTKAAIQAKVMAREKLTDAEKAFVLGGYKAPKTDAPVGAKADAPKDAPKAAERAAAEPKATDDGDIDNDYINRHLERHGDKSPTEKRWLAGNFEGQGSPEHAAAGLGGTPMHNQATRSKLAEILRGQADRADARAKDAPKASEKPQDAGRNANQDEDANSAIKQAYEKAQAHIAQRKAEETTSKAKADAEKPAAPTKAPYVAPKAQAPDETVDHDAVDDFMGAGEGVTLEKHQEMLNRVREMVKTKRPMTGVNMATTKEMQRRLEAKTTEAPKASEKPQDAPKAEAGGDGAKDTPKQAYTAPQATGQGAGAAAPEPIESRDAKVDRAFHEGAAKATGGLGEEVRPLDRNIHGMAAMLKEAGVHDVTHDDVYRNYYHHDLVSNDSTVTPTTIREGMERHAQGMAASRKSDLDRMQGPGTYNAEHRATTLGEPERHARDIFDAEFKRNRPNERLRSKAYNDLWARNEHAAMSMSHNNIAGAHENAAKTIEHDMARSGPDERTRNGLDSARMVARHLKALDPESSAAHALGGVAGQIQAKLDAHQSEQHAAVKRLRDKAAHHRAEAERHAALHKAGKGAVREAFTLTPRIGGYSAPTSIAAR